MSSTPWPVAADAEIETKPPLVLVSNMYPSDRHPAYGLFVQRSAEQVAPHFRMHYLTMPKTLSRVRRVWRYLKLNVLLALSLLLRQQAVHVVHFPLFFAPALWLVPLTRTSLVLNFHGTDNLLNTRLKRAFGRVLKRATRRAHIVAPSADFASELAERYALNNGQVFVSPSAGVDTECFHPVVKLTPDQAPGASAASVTDTRTGTRLSTAGSGVLHQSQPVCHVGFVSTLLEEKGWRDFLLVVQELIACSRPGTFRFSMVGSGPDDERVAADIHKRALPIERHPTMNHRELAAFYQDLSVLLYPSRRESLGLTAIECLACGTPVIAQAIPGPGSYIVSGENGTLVAPGDTDGMREAVLAISVLDVAERSLLMQHCSASVARYDSVVVGAEMVGFLRKAGRDKVASRAAETQALMFEPGASRRHQSSSSADRRVSAASLEEQQLRTLLCRNTTRSDCLSALEAISDEGQALTRYAGDRQVLQLLARPLERLSLESHPAETLRDLACQVRDTIAARNTALVADYHALASVLEGEGIPVVPLKGVAALLDGCYPDTGERLSNDIDVLIPPAALPRAMVSLAAADYRQAVNRFERPAPDTDMFGAMDIGDFRNQAAYVDSHVPRILATGANFNVEVHIHVTTQRSILCRELDERAADNPDTLFHLLHNFEHSHLKDGYGALGGIDWRHLVDADRRFNTGNAGAWAAQLMTVAQAAGVEAAMAVHLWQLEAYLGTAGIADAGRNERFATAIESYQRVQHSRARQWLARQRSLVRRVGRGFVSKRVRDERFGPVSTRQQLLRTWRFYRGELRR